MSISFSQDGVNLAALVVPDCLVNVELPPGSQKAASTGGGSGGGSGGSGGSPQTGALDFSDPNNSGLIGAV